MASSRVEFNNLNPLHLFRELEEPLDLPDPLAKMERGEHAVRLVLLVALVRLVLVVLLDPLERKDLVALMVPL